MRKLNAGLLALGCLLHRPSPAAADQPDRLAEASPPGGPLELVVVTASRRETSMSDVAAAVSRVDEQQLRELAPEVLAAALRGQPGAFFQQTTPGQGIPIIRGLKGSQVLHLVDGMRLNNAFFRDAPNQYLALVDSFATERVEVLRGAAGSLYGADAMGGVVQVLSPEVRFSGAPLQQQGRLYGAWNSVNQGWTLRIDGALGKEGASLSLGGSYQDIGNRRTGDGDTIVPSAYTSKAGDAKLLLDLGMRSELMLSAQVLEQPSTPRVDELVPGFGQAEPAAEQFLFEPNRRSFVHGRYRLAGDGGWYEQLELHLARQVITDDRLTRDFGSPLLNREQNQSELDGFTAQLDQALGDTLLASWGLEFYRDTVSSARQVTDLDSGQVQDVRARFPDGSRMDSNALYLAGNWAGNGRLSLDAGLRYSWFEVYLPGAGDVPDTDLSPEDLTGDLRAVYELNEQLNLVANLGRGFRPPNVFDLGTLGPRPGNRFNVANPALGPEQVWSYDLGLKGSGSGWQFELFAFYLDYRDKITSVLTGEVTADGRIVVRSENRSEVELYGLEAGWRWQFSPDLELFASLNYTRGEEYDPDGGSMPADRIPPLNGQAGLLWTPTAQLEVRPYLLFAGAQDRLSPRDVGDPRINPDGTPGWGTINLDLSWQASDRLRVGMRLENMGDQAYREHGSGIDAPGRNLGVWISSDF